MLEVISLDSVRESMPSWAILIWGVIKYPVIAMAYYFLFYFIAKIFEAYIFPYIVNITEKTNTSADTKIITAFKNPVKRIILTLGVYMAITSIPFIGENYQELLLRLYRSLVIAFIASGFYNLADTSSSFFEKIKTKFNLLTFLTSISKC